MNLIKRATEICSRLKIDPDDLVRCNDLYDSIMGESVMIGTVLLSKNKDGADVYTIYLTGGWHKQYYCRGQIDMVRIIRDMSKNSMKPKVIADILGISTEQISSIFISNPNNIKKVGK